MVENFGGSLNLVIWVLLFIGAAFYSFRCLFQTKAFNDQYGFGDSGIFMTRSSWCCGSYIISLIGQWPRRLLGFRGLGLDAITFSCRFWLSYHQQ
jgi:hypothetical protein